MTELTAGHSRATGLPAAGAPGAAQSFARRWRKAFRHPLFYAQVAVTLLLCGFILYPVTILLNQSVRDRTGSLSSRWFVEAFTRPSNFDAIANTLMIAGGVSLVSTLAGTFMAWAVVRTDMPGRRVMEVTSVIPFITSSFIGAMAWIMLASPEAGLINQLWQLLGFETRLVNIYSMGGIIFVQALYDMPIVFLMVAAALRSMDPSLEEASLSAGAGVWKTTARVTLPLVLPAVLASALLVFVLAAEQYGVPAVLGTPARIRVLTTSIVEAQTRYPPAYGVGAALCVILLGLALAALWLQRRILRGRSFTTVGGKSARPRQIALGPLRWAVFAIALAYMLLAIVLPFGTLFLSSIRTLWTPDIQWSQLTLQNYWWVLFEYPITQRAIRNSIMLAFAGATIGMLLAALIAFLTLRIRLPGNTIVEYLGVLPLGFPGVVLAFALLQAWISPPLVLYGTFWILLLAYVTAFLPIGIRSISATIVQIHPELEEASLSSGAGWLATFRRVTVPLLKPGFIAGWSLLFILCMRELSSSVLLYSPTREVLSVAIYDMRVGGQYRELSALAIIQIAIALVLLGVVRMVTRDARSKAVAS